MRKLIVSAAVIALVAAPELVRAQEAEPKAQEQPGLLSQMGATVGGLAATTAGAAAGGPLGGAAAGLAGQKAGGGIGGFVDRLFRKKPKRRPQPPPPPSLQPQEQAEAKPAAPLLAIPPIETPGSMAATDAGQDAAAEAPFLDLSAPPD